MREVLLVFLVLGVVLLLGLNSTERGINETLQNGYATSARITSAEVTDRRFPFVFDGWRPRWVDENLSVGLTWTGRDGVVRSRRGVPVSSAFAGKVLRGDRVQMIKTRVHVLEDDSALPVIDEDATDRLRHIQSFFDIARYGAIGSGAALLGLMAWWLLSPDRQYVASPKPPFTSGQMIVAVVSVFFALLGGTMARQSWIDQRDFAELRDRGDAARATITRAYIDVARAGDPPDYRVELAWQDEAGQERVFGPTHVSLGFWRRLTTNGAPTAKQVDIRYLASDPSARPLIVADAEDRAFQVKFGFKGGLGMAALGVALGSGLMYWRRRQYAAFASATPHYPY